MLNELENKIRKAIPELIKWEYGHGNIQLPIQLNHVLEYAKKNSMFPKDDLNFIINLWNLKSNLLSDQSQDLIKYLNEL